MNDGRRHPGRDLPGGTPGVRVRHPSGRADPPLYEHPRRCPKAPDFLEGVVQYGGGAVPVVDLRKRFELEAPIRDETRMMVLELETSGWR